MGRTKDDGGSALERLREFGLRYPGAHTKSPWPGHLDLAVNDKTFAYMSIAGEPLKISCKLPRSSDAALALPFTTPTAYGLGKSGWVTATFPDGTSVPVELLEEWIDESYRAQAPKRLSAKVPAHGAAGAVSALGPGVAPRAARRASAARAEAGAQEVAAKPRARPVRSASAAPARRSTVKQGTRPARAPEVSARSAPPRSAARAAAPAARIGAPSRRAGGSGQGRARTAPAGKRASVSPRAAKRTSKK